jgi:uncharacterized membrane protein
MSDQKTVSKKKIERLPIDRMNAMSDGILAIVITLLVLGIDIPTDHRFSEQGLLQLFIKLKPSLTAYGVSFMAVAVFWIQHTALFQFLRHVNRHLVWLNILFLLPITLIPFVAKLKAVYRYEPLVVMLFASVLTLCGLFLLFIWIYVLTHPELLVVQISSKVKRSMTFRIIVSPLICLIAMGVAFVDVDVGTYVFTLIPLFYFSHHAVDASIQEMM